MMRVAIGVEDVGESGPQSGVPLHRVFGGLWWHPVGFDADRHLVEDVESRTSKLSCPLREGVPSVRRHRAFAAILQSGPADPGVVGVNMRFGTSTFRRRRSCRARPRRPSRS